MSDDNSKVLVNKIRVQKTRVKSRNITKLGENLVEKVTVTTDTVEKVGSDELKEMRTNWA